MLTRFRLFISALLIVLATGAFGGISSVPGLGAPTYSQAELNAAIAQARATGRQEAAAECIGSPADCGCVDSLSPCGITLSSVLSGAFFGETEPNDHIIAADALITQVTYWGQAYSQTDQDWFYLTTVEPNQILTINFKVPTTSLSALAQEWIIQVRDAAGNIYAQFDTRYAVDDPTTLSKDESEEITFPVFLGHTGTYYVVVLPTSNDTSTQTANSGQPYNLAAVLGFSGLDTAPPDVNFHDNEVENNDTMSTANPLASGVTMYGFLHQNAIDAATGEIAGDEDWFSYTTPGTEQVVLAWCGKQACDATAIWSVEVYKPDMTLLLTTTTDKSETIRFSLLDAGTYYIRVRYQVKTDPVCLTRSDTNVVCSADPVPVCNKDTANRYDDVNCTNAVLDDGSGAAPVDTTEVDAILVPQTTNNFCSSAIDSTSTYGCASDGTFSDNDTVAFSRGTFVSTCTAGVEFECIEYDNTIDPNSLNVPYNFTFWGSKLLPLTNGTGAFDVFQERPGFYTDR